MGTLLHKISRALPDKLYELNYLPVFNSIVHRLQAWSTRKYSCRMVISKMGILPRSLYVYQTLPIFLPRLFYWSLHTAIRYEILVKCKMDGDARVPHMELYHMTTILTWVLDWVSIRQQKLEVPMASLPWLYN